MNPFTSTYQNSGTIEDMVLAELSPDLISLLFGSYLSSTSGTYAGSVLSALVVDATDKLVVVGTTLADNFPTTNGSYQTSPALPTNSSAG